MFSHTRSEQLGRRGRGFPTLFENWKSFLIFGKKTLIELNLEIKFSTQDVVFRVSKRKIPRMFPYVVFFPCAIDEKSPSSMKLPLPRKISGCKRATGNITKILQNIPSEIFDSVMNMDLSQ